MEFTNLLTSDYNCKAVTCFLLMTQMQSWMEEERWCCNVCFCVSLCFCCQFLDNRRQPIKKKKGRLTDVCSKYWKYFCFFLSPDGNPESRIDLMSEPGKESLATKACMRKMVIAGQKCCDSNTGGLQICTSCKGLLDKHAYLGLKTLVLSPWEQLMS